MNTIYGQIEIDVNQEWKRKWPKKWKWQTAVCSSNFEVRSVKSVGIELARRRGDRNHKARCTNQAGSKWIMRIEDDWKQSRKATS